AGRGHRTGPIGRATDEGRRLKLTRGGATEAGVPVLDAEVTLFAPLHHAIAATDRTGVGDRMLAGGMAAIALIEGADIAIIGTGRAGRLEAIGRAENTGARAGRGHIA